jgi:fibronectin type 3 domain-containing protein
VDFQGHISKYSAPLKLLKPDTIPPFPPGITHYGQEKGHVYIDWSPSRTKDLSKHTLYKKVNDGKWEKVKDLAVSTHRIIDKEVMTDSFYTYKILAVDDAGLMSDDHATIRLKFIDKRLPQAPAIVDCRLLDGKGIHLEWEGLPEEGSTIIVYRSINGGVMTVLDRIEREENIYVDKNIRKGHAYQYALKVKWPDGKRSPFSEIVHPENLKK